MKYLERADGADFFFFVYMGGYFTWLEAESVWNLVPRVLSPSRLRQGSRSLAAKKTAKFDWLSETLFISPN